MKRIIAFILIFALCFSLTACGGNEPAPSTQPKEDTITIHAQIPADWTEPGCWAWSTVEEKDAFAQWPGEVMTLEGGWYVTEAPSWINYVIINGNGGTAQTADLPVEVGKDLWVIVKDATNASVYYEEPVVDTITVHAQIPADWTEPGCWAWSTVEGKDAFAQWPGVAMTQDDGWYVTEAPGWINYVIINGNAGSAQTADLPVEIGKDLWVIVTDSANASVYYEEPAQKLVDDFSKVGTLNADQITDCKFLPYVYRIENGKELSKEVDLTLLPKEMTAAVSEEVRYILHYKYTATPAIHYVGNLSVYNTSIELEIEDVVSGYIVAYEEFQGAALPDSITSTSLKFYADYPDEATVKEWIYQQFRLIQEAQEEEASARMAEALSLAQSILERGSFSYSGLIESLMDKEVSGLTYEEAVYAADHCGADWFKEAAESAVQYIGWGVQDTEMLIQLLTEEGFTHEQAVYGAENSGI